MVLAKPRVEGHGETALALAKEARGQERAERRGERFLAENVEGSRRRPLRQPANLGVEERTAPFDPRIEGRGVQLWQQIPPQVTLTVDFADAVTGLETTLYLTTDAQCSTCNGSGAKPGTSPKVCSICQGRGVTDDNQGMFSFSSPCQACQGRGSVIESPCGTCRGGGIERRPREVKTRLPAGVKDGQTIRLKGRGGPGRNGGPHGDLLVQLKVMPHQQFGRSDNNLTVAVPVSFADAALGADIDVPTLAGPTVTMHIKAGTQSGSRHRVRGKGIETTKAVGDLIVTVNVVVPTKLTDAQRQAITELREATTVVSESAATKEAHA